MNPDVAVRAALAAQVAAWNRKDLDGFMQTYWNDPGLTFYSGDRVTKGWRETKDRYRKRYLAEGKEMGRLSFDIHAIDACGPDITSVKAAWKLDLAAGPASGLFTLLLRKLPDGWKIVHDHTSAKTP